TDRDPDGDLEPPSRAPAAVAYGGARAAPLRKTDRLSTPGGRAEFHAPPGSRLRVLQGRTLPSPRVERSRGERVRRPRARAVGRFEVPGPLHGLRRTPP